MPKNCTYLGRNDTDMISLAIIYDGHGGRPLRLARVLDRSLLRAVAAAAIAEAEQAACDLAVHDAILGQAQLGEVSKLRQILQPLVAGAGQPA